MVDGSDGSGGVDNILANGPKGVLKQYFPLEWLIFPMLGGFSCGGGGDGGDGGGGCGDNGYRGLTDWW